MKKKKDNQVFVPARLSYMYAWEPDEETGKYSTQLLIDKSDKETLAKIKAAIKAAVEGGKSRLANSKGKIPRDLKMPLHDGDTERDGTEYEGMFYFNASTKNKPVICDRRRQAITDRSEVYSGCYANVAVNFYAFSKGGSAGIAAGLLGIQKVRDGEQLGGSSVSAGDFEDLGEEAADDFLPADTDTEDEDDGVEAVTDLDSLLG